MYNILKGEVKFVNTKMQKHKIRQYDCLDQKRKHTQFQKEKMKTQTILGT